MSKHNPKLNPQAPYKNAEVWALPLAERRKVAVDILCDAVKRANPEERPHARAIRKACGITARQFRKAVKEANDRP